MKQITIKKKYYISGIGLHTGKKSTIKLLPSDENRGIIFRKIDLYTKFDVPALISNVVNTDFSTVIMKNKIYIITVEHLLSAVYALGIDNLIIELDFNELPFLDGSSYPFFYILKLCGTRNQNLEKKFLKIKKTILLCYDNKVILAMPSDNLKIIMCMKIDCFFKSDFYCFNFNENDYLYEISKSRTFGIYNLYQNLLAKNLSNGANLKNVLIFEKNIFLNKNIIRYENEILKHKLLDFLGDLSLLGKNIIGSFLCIMPSHKFNLKFLNLILLNSQFYEIL